MEKTPKKKVKVSVNSPSSESHAASHLLLAAEASCSRQQHVIQALLKAKHHKLLAVLENQPTTMTDDRTQSVTSNRQFIESINSITIEKVGLQFAHLFEQCSTKYGKKLSKRDRAVVSAAALSSNLSLSCLVYGEISFETLAQILWCTRQVPLPQGGVFYDLGSGTGRAVFGAALLHDFSSCVGIEILSSLVEASTGVLQRFNKDIRPQLPAQGQSVNIAFKKASFLEVDWTDGDVVFINSTCFSQRLMQDISAQAERLKKGACVITITQHLSSDEFTIISSNQHKMTWGLATVHIHIRN